MFVALGDRDEILRGVEDMAEGIRSVLAAKV